jgi:hypothetical protein
MNSLTLTPVTAILCFWAGIWIGICLFAAVGAARRAERRFERLRRELDAALSLRRELLLPALLDDDPVRRAAQNAAAARTDRARFAFEREIGRHLRERAVAAAPPPEAAALAEAAANVARSAARYDDGVRVLNAARREILTGLVCRARTGHDALLFREEPPPK